MCVRVEFGMWMGFVWLWLMEGDVVMEELRGVDRLVWIGVWSVLMRLGSWGRVWEVVHGMVCVVVVGGILVRCKFVFRILFGVTGCCLMM